LTAAFVYPINTVMNIQELDAYNLDDAVKFNDRLNPALWNRTEHLKPEIKAQLLLIAEDFRESLGIKDLDLKDITISGSNAAYTYTPNSDIDLHLVVDQPEDPIYRELFDAKKAQYNDTHDIKIKGFDVEVYVEAADKPPISQGTYSLLQDKWVQVPKRVKADVDDTATRNKFETIGHAVERAIKTGSREKMDRMARKIKRMRQTGLDQHGEFGPENLAFKMLRSQGVLKQLHDARVEAKNKELSLKERRRPHSVFTYGFKHESAVDEGSAGVKPVTLTPDGLSPDTVMIVSDVNDQSSDEEILKDFIDFCSKELKLEQMPTIKLKRDPQWPVVHKTFGRYTNDKNLLEVAWGQRHIMDVLRTVAHELTHKHQHERDGDAMGADAGETGSKWENEANARAGILMRDYARLHPDYFAVGQVEELHGDEVNESASGYIPTKKQAKDPRFVMALTKDVQPGAVGKEANKLKLKTNSQGKPQQLRADGLFEDLMLEYKKFKQANEDYSPDTPPGPESKPTMPKGTVRVDVSDMYDWYKLGKNISNLKAADKSQFGKGPPSTIVSFGDEDTEHKYIKDLENLGLTTTDIDPLDPKKPKGISRQKVDPTYNVNESEELDEVRMAPSNLRQFADSEAAEGIQAGFEAELIFRDTEGDSDSDDLEPDYDYDERCRSLSQVVDFFSNDDWGYGLSRRERDELSEKLDEAYYEWHDEQMYEAWQDERDEKVRDLLLEEQPWTERLHAMLVDGMELSDEEAEKIIELGEARKNGKGKPGEEYTEEELEMLAKYSEAASDADLILDEEVESSIAAEDKIYDSALDLFRDDFYIGDDSGFFSDVGWRWMSDIADEFNLSWPYYTGGSNGGDRDWDSIADSLSDAIDMPVRVSSGYHQMTRKPGVWIVEPDSSLEPDEREDVGLEIVSPPMPLKQALEKLQQVTDWANGPGNAYTNDSTGLHMGVSIPYKGGNVDYLKLIMFLGDEYVLQQFGRESNTYTKAAMKEIRSRAGSERNATAVLELLRNNLVELAERELARSTGEGKYTSAHKQGKYIEFRSAGGDWLAEDNADPEKLPATMMRYAYAMYLAGRPDLERKEYAKKLYKLVANGTDDSTMALFSQFATGMIDKDQLKKQWAEKTLSKEEPRAVGKDNWVVVDKRTRQPMPGGTYNGYTRSEALERAEEKFGEMGWRFDLEPQNTGRWEVYRDDQGQEETLEIIDAKGKAEAVDKAYEKYTGVIPFKVRAYHGEDDPGPKKEPSRRAKLAKQIIQKPAKPKDYNYEIVNLGDVNLGVVDKFYAVDKKDADATFDKWLQMKGLPNDTNNYGYRPRKQQTAQQTGNADPAASSDWEAVWRPTGRVVDTLAHADAEQATTWRQMVIRQHGFEDNGDLIIRRAGEQTPNVAQNFSAQTPPDATQQVGSWSIYDVTLNREIARMDNVSWQQATDRAEELERGTGHNMSVRGLN